MSLTLFPPGSRHGSTEILQRFTLNGARRLEYRCGCGTVDTIAETYARQRLELGKDVVCKECRRADEHRAHAEGRRYKLQVRPYEGEREPSPIECRLCYDQPHRRGPDGCAACLRPYVAEVLPVSNGFERRYEQSFSLVVSR